MYDYDWIHLRFTLVALLSDHIHFERSRSERRQNLIAFFFSILTFSRCTTFCASFPYDSLQVIDNIIIISSLLQYAITSRRT